MTATAIERLDILARERGIELQSAVPLAPLTTLRVGGPAERLAAPETVDDLVAVLAAAREAGVAVFMLGKGSDVVVADSGIRGLVVRTRTDGIGVDGTSIRAEAGTAMAGLARRAAREGLAGFDWAISIPGSFGGAIWANAGAHDGEMAHVIREVDVLDLGSGERATIAGDACAFGYRDSRFKLHDEVVLAGVIDLEPGDPDAIGALIEDHQARRRATQPLADQNAGSVFRNPPGDHAGRLIEAVGLKGRRRGTAQVSTLHANFIVTDRGAGRAADVRALGDEVRATVAERTGVELEYEIAFVGDWPAERDR